MLEMRERRAQPAQQTRHRPAHPELLGGCAEDDRLDPGGHELWMPRDRREPELIAAERRQPAEQVLDVGLVAGPLPAEHVGVEHDERLHAAPSGPVRGLTPPASQVGVSERPGSAWLRQPSSRSDMAGV